jgi:hypothetical protein
MNAAKSAFVAVCALGGVGAVGVGFMESGGAALAAPFVRAVSSASVRAYPPMPVIAHRPAQTPKKPETAEPTGAVKAASAAAPSPEHASAKPPPAKPESAPATSDAAPKTAHAGSAEAAGVPSKAAPREAIVNLTASNTADIFIDGKKVGSSPLLGVKVRPGMHHVRFDCYDAAANVIPGEALEVSAVANEEQNVDFSCPE